LSLRATVSFDPAQTDLQQLRAAVQKAGYDAIVLDPTKKKPKQAKRRQNPVKPCKTPKTRPVKPNMPSRKSAF